MSTDVTDHVYLLDEAHPRELAPEEPCEECGAPVRPRPDHPALIVPLCAACRSIIASGWDR